MFVKFEGHQAFDQKLKTFLLLSCLMGDVLFVWKVAYKTCLMRACVPRLLSGLFQLFDLCLIKHVLFVWSLTSTSACLVTKQCLMMFGRQTFPVCPGLKGGMDLNLYNIIIMWQFILFFAFFFFTSLTSVMLPLLVTYVCACEGSYHQ